MVEENIAFRPLEDLSQSVIPKKKQDFFLTKPKDETTIPKDEIIPKDETLRFKGIIRKETSDFNRNTVLERLKRNSIITNTCHISETLMDIDEEEEKVEKIKDNKKPNRDAKEMETDGMARFLF